MLVWKLTMNEYDRVVFMNLNDLMSVVKIELQNVMGDPIYEEIDITIKPQIMNQEDIDSLVEADI